MLYVICYFWYMLFWYMLFVLPVVCRLLRRCWLPSRKNFAALKKFGVCDNKHFDFDKLKNLSGSFKFLELSCDPVVPKLDYV